MSETTHLAGAASGGPAIFETITKIKPMKAKSFFSTELCLLAMLAVILSMCGGGGNEGPGPEPNPNPGPGVEITPDEGITLYGFVGDADGKAIPGVVVTDGYSVVTTDQRGVYQIVRHSSALYVYISVPSGYEIPKQSGYGSYTGFYQAANSVTGSSSTPYRADFQLTERDVDDNDFVIFAIGDPQPSTDAHVEMFRTETIPDLMETAREYSGIPQVALGLGDIVGGNPERTRFEVMKRIFGSTGIPWFVTIGNHDKSDGGGDHGELFRSNFGPLWYSFNMGQAHFICLDNIIFGDPSDSTDYLLGITDVQVEWLKKDLEHVPTDKLLILFYHIPLRNLTSSTYRNVKEVLDIVSRYPNRLMMCGHTHYFWAYENAAYGHHEHILGAACGYFWRAKIQGDGSPNGYVVYEISGNGIKNQRFKGTNRDKEHQIRLYRGDAEFTGPYSNAYKYTLGSDYVVANVFFANVGGEWKIEVYEDGTYSGDMSLMASGVGDQFFRGYLIGNRNNSTNAEKPCYHQFQYRLKNPNAQVTVKATDSFGNVYTQSVFTESNQYDEAESYQ